MKTLCIVTTIVLLSSLALQAKTGANAFFKAKTANNITYAVTTRGAKVVYEDKTIYARVTVYWSEGGDSDYYTRHKETATGMPLVDGESAAVDPSVIPYGSNISIPGYGTAKAVDTGSAVISRKASRECGSHAPVIDLYFKRREEAENWSNSHPQFENVTLL